MSCATGKFCRSRDITKRKIWQLSCVKCEKDRKLKRRYTNILPIHRGNIAKKTSVIYKNALSDVFYIFMLVFMSHILKFILNWWLWLYCIANSMANSLRSSAKFPSSLQWLTESSLYNIRLLVGIIYRMCSLWGAAGFPSRGFDNPISNQVLWISLQTEMTMTNTSLGLKTKRTLSETSRA